ncbi:MAG: allophanate hydrolase subunit 1 [Stigonema ocellatum SAG 48.90 = DSM 106950]|nr:allophanate hydrolase subunit 1 [Stigonema ocellatum SAG 48.90 = DSM 106950]
MIYQKPRYRVAGERHLLVELGDEISLATNFKAIALAQKMIGSPDIGPTGIKAVIDVVPSFTTVLIQYQPQIISFEGLIRFCDHCLQHIGQLQDLELASRLIEIPVAYNDRWCQACFEQYCQTIKPIERNPEFVARLNGLRSLDELINYHSTPIWWVGSVGFVAGLPILIPLDPSFRLYAPKYDPPRTWTPKGTIGVGGGLTAIYPIVIPDGYQMLGRTPVPIFDQKQRLQPFRERMFLFQLGDRVKFRPISEEEFEAIETEVEVGRYEYKISELQKFDLSLYLQQEQLSNA